MCTTPARRWTPAPSPLPNYENKGWSTEGTDSASHSYLGASALGVVTLARTPSPYIKLYAEAIAKYEYIPVFDSSLWVAADVLAAGSMTYAVEAVGPPGKVKAIVNAEAVATIPSSNGAAASALIQLDFDLVGPTVAVISEQSSFDSGNGIGIDNTAFWFTSNANPVTLQANTIYYVMMSLTLQAHSETENFKASAKLDPIFTLIGDNAELYSLAFSPGVGNAATSAPNSTWVMLSFGFFALGLLARGRRSRFEARWDQPLARSLPSANRPRPCQKPIPNAVSS